MVLTASAVPIQINVGIASANVLDKPKATVANPKTMTAVGIRALVCG
jgi:hypothetical protein